MFEIGNTLREARLRRGLDILDCEAETKIRAKYLRAMEEEQFDLMPSPTYVRGFLRAYADFLDLDGRLVLDEYESRFGDYAPGADLDRGRSVRTARTSARGPSRGGTSGRDREPPRRAARPRRRRRTEVQLLWLAIGGVMSVALLVWLGVGSGDTGGPLPEPPATSSASSSTPVAPVLNQPDTASTEAPMRAKKTPIVLTGTGTNGCWVQVRSKNAKGRLVYEAILAPGSQQTFKVLEGIYLRAANPAELKVTVAGKEKDLGSETGSWIITPTEVRSVG
jgi:cytoskeletal protein RodZ